MAGTGQSMAGTRAKPVSAQPLKDDNEDQLLDRPIYGRDRPTWGRSELNRSPAQPLKDHDEDELLDRPIYGRDPS